MDGSGQQIAAIRQKQTEGWRVLGKTHRRGTTLEEHQHRSGQLVYAVTGLMVVITQSGRWTIPPQRALWIPPQKPHSIVMLSDAKLRTVYVTPAVIAQCDGFARVDQVHAIRVSQLLSELILGLFEDGRDNKTCDAMVALLLRILGEGVDLPTHLPLPSDRRLRSVSFSMIDQKNWNLSVQDAADLARMSTRNFTRRFSADVGINFRAWRQTARVIASLDLLIAGLPIKEIARKLDYQSSSAFIAAFRSILNASPADFAENSTVSGRQSSVRQITPVE